MAVLRRLYDNFERYLSIVLIGVMVACLIAQVGARILWGGSIAWAEELSRYCFIWAVYIGAAMAAQRAAHVRVFAHLMLAPVRIRLTFRIIADAVWTIFNLFLTIVCTGLVLKAIKFPETSPTLGLTVGYLEAIIPLSALLIAWRTVELYIRHYRNGTLETLVSVEKEAGLT
jgi:TRAP-type C4-dicarboxylate transport system permease small subunit